MGRVIGHNENIPVEQLDSIKRTCKLKKQIDSPFIRKNQLLVRMLPGSASMKNRMKTPKKML